MQMPSPCSEKSPVIFGTYFQLPVALENHILMKDAVVKIKTNFLNTQEKISPREIPRHEGMLIPIKSMDRLSAESGL